ncbi:hypothetical protein MBIO_0884 [Mycoplasmopsis fermentans PG18]|uniref:Uncharacterized protein n=1 Tax=Mycoplasmopsis fermentans (strain ATCC 19989 / NBRC 14854 / NCTC 10117 / PG18) TaxID=496833 RepID=C4XG77_MYCFP|nr:hypothetical protein MBIO_0884 [Mycoplasmopsis fermentans PG18]
MNWIKKLDPAKYEVKLEINSIIKNNSEVTFNFYLQLKSNAKVKSKIKQVKINNFKIVKLTKSFEELFFGVNDSSKLSANNVITLDQYVDNLNLFQSKINLNLNLINKELKI